MGFISLGEFNKNMIYPLVGTISKIIASTILFYGGDHIRLNSHPFIIGINSGFGMSLAIIPYLYIRKFSKKKKGKKLISKKYIEIIYNQRNPVTKRKKYLLLFLCAFLDFSQKILSFNLNNNLNNNQWIFNIVFLNLFELLLGKNQLYKHQYFSSGIMVFFGIVLNIINLYDMGVEDIPKLIISILLEIMYSLAIVLAKYGMDDLFCSPFEITFYEGIFSLILNIIFLFIATNMPIPFEKVLFFSELFKVSQYNGKYYFDNFYLYIQDLKFIEVLLFIVHMIARASFNLFSHITIKHYTSSHVILILIFGEMILCFKEDNINDILIKVAIFFVELIMILIFCEIIELNFCGFEKNTRKNIKERASSNTLDENKDIESEASLDGFEVKVDDNSTVNEKG